MNEEEKFDELLQSKLSERDFPFDELNWDEAEKQIIAQENRKKMLRFGLIFGCGLLAGMAIMLPFIKSGQSSVVSGQSAVVRTSSNLTGLPAAAKKSTGAAVLVNSTPVNSVPVSNKKSTKPHPLPHLGASTTLSHQGTLSGAEMSTQSPSRRFGHGTGFVRPIKPLGQATASITQKRKSNKNKEVNETSSESANNETSQTNLTELQNELNEVTNNTTIPNVLSIKDPGDTNHSKFVIAKSNLPKHDSVKPNGDSLKSNMAMLRVPDMNNCISGFKPRNSISLDGGLNYAIGWIYNGTQEGNGVTPIVGFSFHHYFSNRISASIGFQAQFLDNLDKTYATATTQYDFGVNQNITTITPKKLDYIGLPVKGYFNVSDRIIIGAGFNLLYLLNTSSAETSYHQTSFGLTQSATSTQSGYMDGFSSTDLQGSLSFSYMVTERFGISAEYYYGFNDIEDPTFFDSDQFDRNSGLRLVLSYQIYK